MKQRGRIWNRGKACLPINVNPLFPIPMTSRGRGQIKDKVMPTVFQVFRRLHVPSCHHVHPKDTVQRKPKFGDKLKDGFNDGFNKFRATFSSPQPSRISTPDPSALCGSSNTRGKAVGGKCLRLDCQQGLMNYTQTQRGCCPSQRL